MELFTRRTLLRSVGVAGTVGGLGGIGTKGMDVIDESGTYSLQSDPPSAIVIRADGVTLDGEGRTVAGPGDYGATRGTGVDILGDDVTIRNLDLDYWSTAVRFEGVSGGLIENCNMRDSLTHVSLSEAEGVTVQNNTADRGGDGTAVFAVDSTDCRILDNDFSPSDNGVELRRCTGFEIRGNNIDHAIHSIILENADGNVIEENSVVSVYVGIEGSGNDNRIVNNTICTNEGVGGNEAVSIDGTGNVIRENEGCPDGDDDLSGTVEVIAASGSRAFEYRFVADGVMFGPETENNDRRVENDDGTTTVLGRVGNGFSDDYEVSGFREFSATIGRPNVSVLLDGEDVTGDVVGPERTVTVLSGGNRERFTYDLFVDGLVEKVRTGDRNDADRNDDLVVTEDGLVVRGVVGSGFGDTYRIWGDVTGFEATTEEANYDVRIS